METTTGSPYDPFIGSNSAFRRRSAGKVWLQMNGQNGFALRALAALAAALVIVIGLAATASAQEKLITIDTASAAVGEMAAVNVNALNIPEPGLGAWTLDITYDPAVVFASACIPESGSVCNPEFDSQTVRITGASAGGVVGDASLGARA